MCPVFNDDLLIRCYNYLAGLDVDVDVDRLTLFASPKNVFCPIFCEFQDRSLWSWISNSCLVEVVSCLHLLTWIVYRSNNKGQLSQMQLCILKVRSNHWVCPLPDVCNSVSEIVIVWKGLRYRSVVRMLIISPVTRWSFFLWGYLGWSIVLWGSTRGIPLCRRLCWICSSLRETCLCVWDVEVSTCYFRD